MFHRDDEAIPPHKTSLVVIDTPAICMGIASLTQTGSLAMTTNKGKKELQTKRAAAGQPSSFFIQFMDVTFPRLYRAPEKQGSHRHWPLCRLFLDIPVLCSFAPSYRW
jgi:hypothetical protein